MGGATLYGLFGGVVGLAVALASVPIIGIPALFAVPLFTGLGIMKGANIFGQIGSTAAIFAEGAEMRERRGALLDRLYITQSQQEADEILKTLYEESQDKPPERMFHWKAMIVGAVIGAAVMALLAYATMPNLLLGLLGKTATEITATEIVSGSFIKAITKHAGLLMGVSAVIGAVGGATIGVDRHYIRRWFDLSENIVYDQSASIARAQARQQDAERLSRIAERNHAPGNKPAAPVTVTTTTPASATPAVTAQSKEGEPTPKVKIHTTGLERAPLTAYDQAMRAPVV